MGTLVIGTLALGANQAGEESQPTGVWCNGNILDSKSEAAGPIPATPASKFLQNLESSNLKIGM